MPDRTTPTDDDDDVDAAGRELAEELLRRARLQMPLLRAAWTLPAPPDDKPCLAS